MNVGTGQAHTIDQHNRERIHNFILGGVENKRVENIYMRGMRKKERERLRAQGRHTANRLVRVKDSEGDKRKGGKVTNRILTRNRCKAFKILQLPRF